MEAGHLKELSRKDNQSQSEISKYGIITCEYKKVPRIAMAAPRALTGWTGVWKIMMDETITEIRFIVFPMLNVKGEISSSDMYET